MHKKTRPQNAHGRGRVRNQPTVFAALHLNALLEITKTKTESDLFFYLFFSVSDGKGCGRISRGFDLDCGPSCACLESHASISVGELKRSKR